MEHIGQERGRHSKKWWLQKNGGMMMGALSQGITDTARGVLWNRVEDDAAMNAWRDQMRTNNEYWEHQSGKSFDRQKELWDYTNVGNQRKHLEDAGLNVGLMYGGAGSGGGATTGGGSGTSTGSVTGQSRANYGDGAMMAGVQSYRAEAEVEAMKAQANKANAEADQIRGVGKDNIVANTNLTNAQTGNAEVDGILKRISVMESDMSRNDRMYQIQMDAQKAYEIAIQEGNKADIGTQTVDDQVRIIRETAIGAALNNNLTNEKVQLTKADRENVERETKAITERILQGDRNLDRQQLEYELEAKYRELNLTFNYIKLASETATDVAGIVSRTGGANKDRASRESEGHKNREKERTTTTEHYNKKGEYKGGSRTETR